MKNPLTMRMEQFTRFTAPERQRLDELISGQTESYAPRQEILRQGQKVDEIHLVLSGLAARSKSLPDGDRQIMAFLIPGDLCDVEVFVLEAMDHDIVAVAETKCALVPAKKIKEILSESSKLTTAMWWSTMTDSAVLRERIIDHGRRDARERLAHLFYEMLIRYRVVGTTDKQYPFPVTQEELADATGLTPVHVNRTMKQLRTEGLIDYRDKTLKVLDAKRLKRVARFEANYLHLDRTEDEDGEVADRVGDLI